MNIWIIVSRYKSVARLMRTLPCGLRSKRGTGSGPCASSARTPVILERRYQHAGEGFNRAPIEELRLEPQLLGATSVSGSTAGEERNEKDQCASHQHA